MVRFGLIGKSLSHSFSPRWFAEKFAREGLSDHRYDLFELADVAEFPYLIQSTPGLRGANVTIPYKRSIISLLDAIDPVATAVGAVNTISIKGGRTTGYNTDVDGFRSTLVPILNGTKPRTLVLGSGGASRAVVFVLEELGIKFRIVSRSRDRGDLTWDLMDPSVVSVSTLIINTTPLGMSPEVDQCPSLPYEAIGPKHCLVDLIYNPEKTLFLKEGERRGARTVNGSAMLQAQAEASWCIWRN